jgi:hypothetical protein
MCSDAPDTSGMNAAAVANAAVSKEALDFFRRAYEDQAPARQEATARANAVSDAQLASMTQNQALSKDYADYQANTFRPMEQALVADAKNYDTQARRDEAAGSAMADVTQQAAAGREMQQRNLTRMGVNPNDGKFAALTSQMGLQEALGKAAAGTQARRNVETQGYARRMDAASLGRGLASNQATSAGIALNAGNSAANTGQIGVQTAQNATQMMGQGFNTAIQGNASAGNLFGQQAQIQGQDGGALGALGSVAGGFLGGSGFAKMVSDKNAKKNVEPTSDEEALEAVENTPVSSWTYKKGQGDGGSHVGPMAQDAAATMGQKAAPGGKMIDLVTMNGITMASVAALSRKVDKLAKQKGARQ